MRVLIVYESMFGNTQMIAKAVAEAMAGRTSVQLVEVDAAPSVLDRELDLLVVGGPTHAYGMSRQSTRESPQREASKRASGRVVPGEVAPSGVALGANPGGVTPSRTGIREWLTTVAPSRPGLPVATFDTRFNKASWITGSAARGAAKQLRRRGFVLIAPPESFFVTTTNGPLRAGEVERARRWGEELARITERATVR